MKKALILLSLICIPSIACVDRPARPTKAKFAVGECVADSPENEFQEPETLKILVVGKQRYQYHRWDTGSKQWSESKDDALIGEVDQGYHKVNCIY